LAKYNENGQAKDDEMDRACSTYGEKKNGYRVLVGNPEGKRRLGRFTRMCKDDDDDDDYDDDMDLREIRCCSRKWIHLAQDMGQ
jgi:hypothetical protein